MLVLEQSGELLAGHAGHDHVGDEQIDLLRSVRRRCCRASWPLGASMTV